METPLCRVPLKGVLLQQVLQKFPDMDTSAVRVMSHIQSCYKGLMTELNAPLAEMGLSEGKFFILVFLFSEELLGNDAPGPSEIAENLDVTRATITGLLDGLERDGLIQRRHSSVDRRAITIVMTEKAHDLMDSFCPAQTGRVSKLLSPLSADEKETLIRLLAKIDPQSEFLERDH